MTTHIPAATTPDGTWTIRRVLEWTSSYLRDKGSESPRLEAEVLLAHARKCPRIQLYTAYDDPLPEADRSRMREMVQRRAASEPVAYIVGHREFFSLDFEVNPNVLIPRPETETLVVEVLERIKSLSQPRILEIGTGSGCIAIALAANHAGVVVTATDVSQAAVDVANANVRRHDVEDRVSVVQGDLYSGAPEGVRFDVIVSNPPYVRLDEIEQLDPDVRLHEPHLGLAGGNDGMDVLRRIIDQSPAFLADHGWLAVECGREQTALLRERIDSLPEFVESEAVNDSSGNPRVVIARRAGHAPA